MILEKTSQKMPKNTISEMLQKPGFAVMNSDASLPNIPDGTGPDAPRVSSWAQDSVTNQTTMKMCIELGIKSRIPNGPVW
jgi:hypothetical protein